ncbi:MAG TPA: hypothetical protein VG225_13840 [Terracidiphilus sp.]|jgi:hypothetical protein|nr:hypothetical protein [Terracidiphilus sp.]
MNRFVALALLAFSASTIAQTTSPANEVVRLVSVKEENRAKRIVMQSKNGVYVFMCSVGAAGCTTPIPGQPYWLLTASSPVGKMDLEWLKNWYVDYHDATNMGVIPAWEGWNKQKDFMESYHEVGSYWLSSFTATK